MSNSKVDSDDHEKRILGRRYDFNLKHIFYNMTRRHDPKNMMVYVLH